MQSFGTLRLARAAIHRAISPSLLALAGGSLQIVMVDTARAPNGPPSTPEAPSSGPGSAPPPIEREKHVRYFSSCLKGLSFHYAGNDQNRLMVVSVPITTRFNWGLARSTAHGL